MPDLIRHPCALGDGPRVRPGVTAWDGPRIESGVTEGRVKPGVTAEGCGTGYWLQRPAKPMLREITSFMISLVPP
jgi:hypothetical protein